MASKVRQDFLLNPDGDFPLQDTKINGVMLPTPYGDSDSQHILDIITSDLGWIKQFPTLGFGVYQYRSAEIDLQGIEKKLKIQMDKDGYIVKHGAVAPSQGKNGFTINCSFIKRK